MPPQRKEIMTKMLTATEAAAALDTDPRTFRKFLRSDAAPIDSVGKGQRYSIEARAMRSLKPRFEKWLADRTPATDDAEG